MRFGAAVFPRSVRFERTIAAMGGGEEGENIMQGSRATRARGGVSSRALALAIVAGLGALSASPAAAQSAAATRYTFDIPAGDLGPALRALADKAGVQIVYSSAVVEGKRTGGVQGAMTPAEALTQLLAGTGLSGRFTGERTAVVEASAAVAADGERMLGPVRVQGTQGGGYFGTGGQAAGVNGVNGSRDVTATEGTKSFTSGALTIGSKVPQSIKDVPQSLSVLTSERLKQQNVTDFATALKQLPGISLEQGATSLESNFYSRGFAITSIQVDGGAPLRTGGNTNFFPQIDMSIYDHVELLRGASGLFNGYGNPGGTVNLVRKKPLDHSQFLLEAQAGSWSNYRVVADATSPLAFGGRLRGRLVLTWQDNHYFYDIAKDNKTLIYGIAEFDVTPTTLVTAGINYTRQDSVPWSNGLPRYQTGADLGLPRSTSLAFPWNRWNFNTREIFGIVEQKLGGEWNLKLNITQNRQRSTRKLGYSAGAVNPTNQRGPLLTGTYGDFGSEQFSAEATLTGVFTLFGQRQEVTIGVNRVNGDATGTRLFPNMITGTAAVPYQPYPGGPLFYFGSPNGNRPPINVFHFNPSNALYTQPRDPLPSGRYPTFGTIQSGAYLNVRLTAFDRLHLTTGVRWSRYEYKFKLETLCTSIPASDPGSPSCFGHQIGDVWPGQTQAQNYKDTDFSWPPAVNVSFDVTKSLSAYVGYTDIYQSQANDLDKNLKPIGPITGSNWEAGLKWSAKGGRLNLSVDAYRIRQKGFAIIDPPDYSGAFEVSPGVTCCWVADPNKTYRSEGVDFEAAGEILPGLQVSGSYTYNNNKQVGSSLGSDQGKPLVSIEPKSLYKLWVSYDFGSSGRKGALSGLDISLGVSGQSSAYYSGTLCVNLDPNSPPNPITGAQSCKSSAPPDLVEYFFTVPPHAVLSGRIDYRISKNWAMAVNFENILDKTYYQTVGSSPTGGNWYGTPRSATVSLRAKW